VVGDMSRGEWLKAAGWSGFVVSLDRRGRTLLAGVDQGYEVIAGHAVDLVVAQLQRNERGLPEAPRAVLFPGRWVEPMPGKLPAGRT